MIINDKQWKLMIINDNQWWSIDDMWWHVMTCDDMMTQWGGRGGTDDKIPSFTEILARPMILKTHFKGHIKFKHRKSSWNEKIFISDLGYAVLSQGGRGSVTWEFFPHNPVFFFWWRSLALFFHLLARRRACFCHARW